MNRFIAYFTFIASIGFLSAFTVMQKKKVIFFGDSITQAGVAPNGYITLLQQMLVKDGKDKAFDLIGAGIGGNKIYDLYLRLEEDVLSKKPDLIFIYVGINDVWHKRSFGTGTDPDKFERFYNKIIDKIQATGATVVICTPTVVGEKKGYVNELDGDLNKYSEIVRRIAKNKKVELIDLHKNIIDYINSHNPEDKNSGILTTDGVHMNDEGNRFLAEQFWGYIK
ncbi:SGNH/GDSL hydrolase family protein [Agriterribacter sp.]|uniref:SGNH/GDSL hydrolase family protein n=1 Tax=Agriterribacter sp. TaxID=2821509 RepID=UPI002C19331C|nr:SGNH/GDSL hydrolase family protein [Agriterribacter sp.]HRO45405.1 SGNH/GDSL hydrolase family protein [Agriterribacter sp.]HRQ16904.1 SGNH/GDSL hydrolase family protein [Agriterribacter sp.]